MTTLEELHADGNDDITTFDEKESCVGNTSVSSSSSSSDKPGLNEGVYVPGQRWADVRKPRILERPPIYQRR